MARNKRKTSRERIVFGNSIINNRLPEAISSQAYLDKFGECADIKFGFFDSATPDYSTYDPNITAADLEPKDDDYYMPLVRALSKIVLNKYGPIDFSQGTILKDSMELLTRQSLYGNHEVMVGNEVGVVAETVWQNASKDSKGTELPAGINARLKIDGKSNPRLVRSMKMDPPAVHSFSVGVTFDWAKSHEGLSDDEFWRKLGTFADDGNLVRRVVTEIQAYHELSLVPHGADPYAQTISNRGINNSDYANRAHKYKKTSLSMHFSEADFKENGHFVDYSNAESLQLISDDTTIPNINKLNYNNNSEQMDELQDFLDSLSQVEAIELAEGQEVTAENIIAAVTALGQSLASAQTDLQSAQTENADLQTQLETANSTLESQKPAVEAFSNVVKATKQEASRLYKLTKGDKASTEMLELIANAETYEAAQAFLKQFKADAEGKFSAKCGDCGSENVTRMSGTSGDNGVMIPGQDENLGDDGGQDDSPKSTDEVLTNLRRNKSATRAEGIHGKFENN